jgi:hypothetical protein
MKNNSSNYELNITAALRILYTSDGDKWRKLLVCYARRTAISDGNGWYAMHVGRRRVTETAGVLCTSDVDE